jgi:hypothetical protein
MSEPTDMFVTQLKQRLRPIYASSQRLVARTLIS